MVCSYTYNRIIYNNILIYHRSREKATLVCKKERDIFLKVLLVLHFWALGPTFLFFSYHYVLI